MANNITRLISSDARLAPSDANGVALKIGSMLPVKPETYGDKFLKGLSNSVTKLVGDHFQAFDASERSVDQALTLGTAWERSAADRNAGAHQAKAKSAGDRAEERVRQAVVALALRDSRDFERLQNTFEASERDTYASIKGAYYKETMASCTTKERAEAREKFTSAFSELRENVIKRIGKSADATDAVTAKPAN